MITPKQQILLNQLMEKFPNMFSQFDLTPIQSPQHKLSQQVHDRVQVITNQIIQSVEHLTPRTIHVEHPVKPLTKAQLLIEIYSRKFTPQYDPHGRIICPF